MKTRTIEWLSGYGVSLAAIAGAAWACEPTPRLIHSSVTSNIADTAEIAVGVEHERVGRFRQEQFGYIDQLRAAIENATARGAAAEANVLLADLGEAQVASASDWATLKAQLDHDLDEVALGRVPAISIVGRAR